MLEHEEPDKSEKEPNQFKDITLENVDRSAIAFRGNATVKNYFFDAPQPTLEDLLQKGEQKLRGGQFSGAVEIFREALVLEPENPEANLFCAIALLNGEGADRLSPQNLAQVEACLKKSAQSNKTAAGAWVIWGTVRYDYYFLNSRSMGNPSLNEIKQRLVEESAAENQNLSQWLDKIQPSQDALDFFDLKSKLQAKN